MISNRNILCTSNPTWEGNYAKTIVELMKVFARNNKVLYVDSPHTIKTLWEGITKKTKLSFKIIFGFENRLRIIKLAEGEVYVLRPPMIFTINFLQKGKTYNAFLKLNGWIVRRSIKKALRALDMKKDLVNFVSTNPWLGVANAGKFKEKTLIYHCYDELSAARWYKKHGPRLEEIMMKMADAVIVTSEGLYERKKSFNTRTFLVKNAVNAKLYSEGFNTDVSNKKVIGYIGSVDFRLDYELISFLAKELPDYKLVFVGRVRNKEIETFLRRNANIVVEGAKNVNELPGYLKTFSVGIIPFKKDEFNKNIYPLKINEYLAAGVPVVTTDFSYLDEFKSIARIAGDAKNFLNCIREEIENNSLEKKLHRKEVAFTNSWEHRAEEISDVILKVES